MYSPAHKAGEKRGEFMANFDWLETDIRGAIEAVLDNANEWDEDSLINRLAAVIKNRVVREMNRSLNEIQRALNQAIDREREVVPAED